MTIGRNSSPHVSIWCWRLNGKYRVDSDLVHAILNARRQAIFFNVGQLRVSSVTTDGWTWLRQLRSIRRLSAFGPVLRSPMSLMQATAIAIKSTLKDNEVETWLRGELHYVFNFNQITSGLTIKIASPAGLLPAILRLSNALSRYCALITEKFDGTELTASPDGFNQSAPPCTLSA